MASPPNSSGQEAAIRKQKKGAPIKFLLPLIYAPALPLIRLSLRRNPVLRDRLFTGVLIGAFAHGFYLVSTRIRVWTLLKRPYTNGDSYDYSRTDLYDIESK